MSSSSRSLRTKWSVAAGPLVFLGFVLTAGAVGGGLGAQLLSGVYGTSTRTRTRTVEEKTWEIRVTHVVFNWHWPEPKEGPASPDGISIRTDYNRELEHGPRKVEVPGFEYGAGEWIVEKDNEGRAKRNEPALYLDPKREPDIRIMARFEATSETPVTFGVKSAKLGFPNPGAWHGVNRVEVKFHDNQTELHKFTRLGRESIPGDGLATGWGGVQQWTKFPSTVPIPDDGVRRVQKVFPWRVYEVTFDNGLVLNFGDEGFPINPSGVPTQQQIDSIVLTPQELADTTSTPEQKKLEKAKGHPFYVVLDTPSSPWFDGDTAEEIARTHPWTKALDVVTKTIAAGGAKDLQTGASRLTFFCFKDGYKYHIGDKNNRGGGAQMGEALIGPAGAVSIKFRLTQFIDKTGDRGNVVACYDCAAGLLSYMNLIGCTGKVHFLKPFGYLNPVPLVGWGVANNPYFGMTVPGNIWGYPELNGNTTEMGLPDTTARPFFDNHTYIIFNGNVFDFNAGPEQGTRNEAAYRASVIDASTASEAAKSNPAQASVPVKVRIVK